MAGQEKEWNFQGIKGNGGGIETGKELIYGMGGAVGSFAALLPCPRRCS